MDLTSCDWVCKVYLCLVCVFTSPGCVLLCLDMHVSEEEAAMAVRYFSVADSLGGKDVLVRARTLHMGSRTRWMMSDKVTPSRTFL